MIPYRQFISASTVARNCVPKMIDTELAFPLAQYPTLKNHQDNKIYQFTLRHLQPNLKIF